MLEAKDADVLAGRIAKGSWAVLFTASWCPQCRAFSPHFPKYEGKSRHSLAKITVEDDDNPAWDHFSVTSIPTVVLFENGKETARVEPEGPVGISAERMRKLLGI